MGPLINTFLYLTSYLYMLLYTYKLLDRLDGEERPESTCWHLPSGLRTL
jgi:hypothetical protein